MQIPRSMNWRHYKGGLYRVLVIARNAGEGLSVPVVVYQCTNTQKVWTQPAARFFGKLQCGTRRFEPVIAIGRK